MSTFTERAMDAMHAYLTDGTTGFNAVTLPDMRTALGVGTGVLPDIAIFEPWYHRAAQATSFPYMSITVDGSTGEMEPNSRFYQVRFQLGLVVLDANIAGDEAATMLALWRYGDAIKTAFQRRVGAGSQGWTLGSSSGIIRATVDAQSPGADPGLANPNVALLTDITVTTSEEY